MLSIESVLPVGYSWDLDVMNKEVREETCIHIFCADKHHLSLYPGWDHKNMILYWDNVKTKQNKTLCLFHSKMENLGKIISQDKVS